MKKENSTSRNAIKNLFDSLSLDDKAAFLVQAAFSTASSALDEIGHRFNDLIDTIAGEDNDEEDTAAAPPEPSTAQERTSSTSTSPQTEQPPRYPSEPSDEAN